MGDKDSRSGGKYGGGHTTLIPAAAVVCDAAHASPHVTKISPGFIKAGLRSVSGRRRVKINDCGEGLLLSVRDNTSHQEVRVYVSNIHLARLDISRGARNAGLHIAFNKKGED